MLSRRTLLKAGAASAAGLALSPLWAASEKDAAMAMRTIPSSGEAIPVIGMGSSGSFEVGTSDQERDPLREVLRRFFRRWRALDRYRAQLWFGGNGDR